MKNPSFKTFSGVFLILALGCHQAEPPAPATPASQPSAAPVASSAAKTPASAQSASQSPAPAPAAPVVPVASKETVSQPPALPETRLAQAAAPTSVPPAPVAPPVPDPVPNRPAGLLDQARKAVADLSQEQMANGLREALAQGLQEAVNRLGHEGGFLTNAQVRIPMPEQLQKVETTLRSLKQDQLADNFVATMNHAAEQAVPEAAQVFSEALKQISVQDAAAILSGPDDAATKYFRRATETNLYSKFLPIVQKATETAGVTAAYKNLLEKANVNKISEKLGSFGAVLGVPGFDPQSLDIDHYVSEKTLDGLFKMVAEEEKQIRENPKARTSELLQKVFEVFKK